MQQNADQQIDELAEKLRELAQRRQEQELQRQRQLAAGQGASNARSNDLQRALAQQAEEAARSSNDSRVSRIVPTWAKQPARCSRRPTQCGRPRNGDPGAAGRARPAAERLRNVQRSLQGAQGARRTDIKDAQRQAEEIAREQREIASDVRNLPAAGAERTAQAQTLGQRRTSWERRFRGSKVSSIAPPRDSPRIARCLAQGAGSSRTDPRRQDQEKLHYSRQVIGVDRAELQEFARTLEEQLEANIDGVRRKLDEAAAALGPGVTAIPMRSNEPASSRAAWNRSAAACRSAPTPAPGRAAARTTGTARGENAPRRSKATKANRANKGKRARRASRGNRASRVSKGSKVGRPGWPRRRAWR